MSKPIRLAQMTSQGIINSLHSFAVLHFYPPKFLEAAAAKLVEHGKATPFNDQSLSNILYAFGKLAHHPGDGMLTFICNSLDAMVNTHQLFLERFLESTLPQNVVYNLTENILYSWIQHLPHCCHAQYHSSRSCLWQAGTLSRGWHADIHLQQLGCNGKHSYISLAAMLSSTVSEQYSMSLASWHTIREMAC